MGFREHFYNINAKDKFYYQILSLKCLNKKLFICNEFEIYSRRFYSIFKPIIFYLQRFLKWKFYIKFVETHSYNQ